MTATHFFSAVIAAFILALVLSALTTKPRYHALGVSVYFVPLFVFGLIALST